MCNDNRRLGEFTCKKCGSHRLVYKEYVKALSEVCISPEGQVHYSSKTIDEDDAIYADFGFECADCGYGVCHGGMNIEAESELLYYLGLDEETKRREDEEWDEGIKAQVAYYSQDCIGPQVPEEGDGD